MASHHLKEASMKHLILVSLLATAAAGAHAETYVDNARISHVEPQYESVSVPRQECRREWVTEARQAPAPDYGGAVVGGIAGALLGNQVGKGHGREAATALAAVVGAFAGNNLANRDRWEPREQAPRAVSTCHMVNEVQTQLVGYRVNYEYGGQSFDTLMRDKPGRFMQVRVSVEPAGR
jgi:uncharacterized protein YcfJ